MNENNIFEGIPSLGDTQGTADYVEQMNQPQTPQYSIPPMLQQNQPEDNAPQDNPAPQNQGGYTQEQINQILEQNKQLQAQMQQIQAQQNQFAQQRVQPRQNAQQSQGAYTPQQQAIIMELVRRGVPMERIQSALNEGAQQNALNARLANMEKYLQEQAYNQAKDAFVDKMTTFGDKFGLSEEDLVQFAQTAYDNGINVADVKDVEAVFRAFYPDQYAIRMQRINGAGASRIYGGANVTETPRMVSEKAMDDYVENYLRGTMPNQYRQK